MLLLSDVFLMELGWSHRVLQALEPDDLLSDRFHPFDVVLLSSFTNNISLL